jgi:DNA-binding protein HU-beta
MRKQDLIRVVAKQTRQSEAQTTATINATIDAIQGALAEGEEVTISGFGSFRVVERAAREGRNPRTGDKMTIGARKSPAFRAGTQLKRAVGGDDAEGDEGEE